MFNLTRSQVLLIAAIIIGLILGKLIKNFKIAFAITLVLALAIAVNLKKENNMQEPSPKYWNRWYAVLLIVLLCEILFFSWLTAVYR